MSTFIDADLKQVEAAYHAGAQVADLHTGTYANDDDIVGAAEGISRHARAAVVAHGMGLQVNAGHGLHYDNVREYIE